jgi:hypothetical protein
VEDNLAKRFGFLLREARQEGLRAMILYPALDLHRSVYTEAAPVQCMDETRLSIDTTYGPPHSTGDLQSAYTNLWPQPQRKCLAAAILQQSQHGENRITSRRLLSAVLCPMAKNVERSSPVSISQSDNPLLRRLCSYAYSRAGAYQDEPLNSWEWVGSATARKLERF